MDYRRYLVLLSLLISTGLSALALSWAFLWRAGELMPAQKAARLQTGVNKEFLYGTAVNQNTLSYKLSLVEAVKPDILIAGSSRVMQFRGWNFEGAAVTAGGAGSSIEELSLFLDRAVAIHTPKVVIIGVDFWWFHPGYKAAKPSDIQGNEVTKDKLLWIFRELPAQRIDVSAVLKTLRNGHGGHIGLNALLHQEGFRRDGSWRYDLTWRTGPDAPDNLRGFRNTLDRVSKGKMQFVHGTRADPERLRAFMRLLRKLETRGVAVQLFLPPLSAPVWKALQAQPENFGHLAELRGAAGKWPFPLLDLSNPALLRASDCEFIDGFHGGDILYARIARELAARSGGLLKTTAVNDQHAAQMNRPSVDQGAFCPAGSGP